MLTQTYPMLKHIYNQCDHKDITHVNVKKITPFITIV